METVVKKLSEIENYAMKIMEETSEQKKQMSQAMEEKCSQYDAMVDKRTKESLVTVTKELHAKEEQELSKLKEQANNSLVNLQRKYEQQHDSLAASILNSIIGV